MSLRKSLILIFSPLLILCSQTVCAGAVFYCPPVITWGQCPPEFKCDLWLQHRPFLGQVLFVQASIHGYGATCHYADSNGNFAPVTRWFESPLQPVNSNNWESVSRNGDGWRSRGRTTTDLGWELKPRK